MNQPLIIAVAPNGARHIQADFPEIPLWANELAQTAEACADQGATMIHLHVRDSEQRHSLEPEHYRPVIAAVSEAVKGRMLIQVTSEAAGIYHSTQQIELMLQLKPDCLSIGLREYVTDSDSVGIFADFVRQLYQSGTLIQYILYDEKDYERYQEFVANNLIPADRHSLLIVIGRYMKTEPAIEDLKAYSPVLNNASDAMVCTFGQHSPAILLECAKRGHHVRMGFENSRCLSDHSDALRNDQLVTDFVSHISHTRPLATFDQTVTLLGG